MNDLSPLPEPRLGRYRHCKGGEYEVVGVARHSETLEPLVLYRPLYNESGLWVRPYAMFFEDVEHEGRRQPRFAPVQNPSRKDMRASLPSSPESQALEIVKRWANAFPQADVEGLVKLFANDATFLGTTSSELVADTDGIRAYFQAALLQNRPRTARLLEYAVTAISDAVVMVTGMDEVTGVKEGQSYSSFGRVTFVLECRGTEWKIVHLHRSALPTLA